MPGRPLSAKPAGEGGFRARGRKRRMLEETKGGKKGKNEGRHRVRRREFVVQEIVRSANVRRASFA